MTQDLHVAVERKAHCKAVFQNSQPVIDKVFGKEVARQVEVYRIEGNPNAKIAFAWFNDSGTPQVELGIPPINSAEAAIRSRAKSIENI